MKICIFGASSDLIEESYKTAVYELGKKLGQQGHEMVFGGGKTGLMGAAARGFKAANGKVIGIAPVIFDSDEILYDCDEKIITADMSSRKAKMVEMSEAFICVAGGIGTYDELFQVLCERQVGYHNKPVIIFNTNGYYDTLIQFLTETYEKGFMNEESYNIYFVSDNIDEICEKLKGE